MAPHTPQRSDRPGGAVAVLDPAIRSQALSGDPEMALQAVQAKGATPPSDSPGPTLGNAPAKPWRSSISRLP
jgi:hypothetical protein